MRAQWLVASPMRDGPPARAQPLRSSASTPPSLCALCASVVQNPMTIIGHGIDLVDVARIAASIDHHGQRFCDRVFTPAEQAYAAGSKRRNEHLAARFAAKEAALKALGAGWRSGIAWTDVEVISEPSGAPTLNITGRAAEIAAARGITTWHISLTHTETQAMASVIASCATDHAGDDPAKHIQRDHRP